MVEAFAIHTNDRTLGNKCVGIDVIDDLENRVRLTAFGQDKHHFDRLSGVKSCSVDDSHAAMQRINGSTDFIKFLGDDEKLDRLPGAVDHLVDHVAGDEQSHITVDHFFPVVQHQIAGSNDNHVAKHDDAPQTDIAVLVDKCGDDVRAACTSVGREGKANTATTENSTDDTRHKGLVCQ